MISVGCDLVRLRHCTRITVPWTEITRPHYVRRGGRYASDSTDAEWALVAGFLPPPKRIGRPRTTELRDVLDAILYMAASGCQWAMLPNDFPPPSTVQRAERLPAAFDRST